LRVEKEGVKEGDFNKKAALAGFQVSFKTAGLEVALLTSNLTPSILI